MLHNNGHSSIDETELAALEKNSESDPSAFTDAESTIGAVLTFLRELYEVFHRMSPLMDAQSANAWIHDAVKNLEKYIDSGSHTLVKNMKQGVNASARLGESIQIPLWSYFHSMYTYLELCKYLGPTLDQVHAKNRKCKLVDTTWLSSKIAILKDKGKELSTNVRISAIDLRDKLRGPAALEAIAQGIKRTSGNDATKDTIGAELDLLGDESMGIYQSIQESWIEALDGVIQIS